MELSLDSHYAALEREFTPVRDPNYERLVVPQGSADEGVHRWFRMKEAYSPSLLERVVKDLGLAGSSSLRLHDPFLGSGTTLASALLTTDGPVFDGTGTEINPFLHLLASTKARALSLSQADRNEVKEHVDALIPRVAAAATSDDRAPARPALNAFRKASYFPRDNLKKLLKMRRAIDRIGAGLSSDLLRLSLAGAIEPSGRLRRDGRALRYEAKKKPEDPVVAFVGRSRVISEDLALAQTRGRGAAFRASALEPGGWPHEPESVDLVCFSPPYPNNIDYTEVYKLENWLLGLINDSAAFLDERKLTVRSHPSVIVPERPPTISADLSKFIEGLAAPIVRAVPEDRYRHQRGRVIKGYLEDMATTLTNARLALKAGGHLVYVVGNSRHGQGESQYTIASDVLIAAVAHHVGFEVLDVKLARSLHRRGRHEHLRESVVFLEKKAA